MDFEDINLPVLFSTYKQSESESIKENIRRLLVISLYWQDVAEDCCVALVDGRGCGPSIGCVDVKRPPTSRRCRGRWSRCYETPVFAEENEGM